ncbi:MAG: ubiquitin-conjugating enzyme E2 [Chitinophagales bacterium]
MGRARDMRLLEDQRKITELAEKVGYFQISNTRGLPPTEYILEFCLNGYLNKQGNTTNGHLVRLSFPERYPFSAPPKFAILRGLFHPNVYKNGDVCHGWFLNNWQPAIHIDDLILDVAKMIAFKADSYNLKSPANYECDEQWIAAHQIPLDETVLEPQEEEQNNLPAAVRPATLEQRRLQKIRVTVKSDKPSYMTAFGNSADSLPSIPEPEPIPIRIRRKNGSEF